MATTESKALAVLESRQLGDEHAVYPEKRTERGHFHVLEKNKSGTSDFASIQCRGAVEDTGRAFIYHLRDGLDTLIVFDNTTRGMALSFKSIRDNHVDIFQQGEYDAKYLDEFSYVGTLSLRDDTSVGIYEFDHKNTGYHCTAIRKESSKLRFQIIAGAHVHGSFVMQPSYLDLTIREVHHIREAILLLGIAFSIWRLIPS